MNEPSPDFKPNHIQIRMMRFVAHENEEGRNPTSEQVAAAIRPIAMVPWGIYTTPKWTAVTADLIDRAFARSIDTFAQTATPQP